MEAVKLPDKYLKDNTIADMTVGQRGFVRPGAMIVNSKGACYLIGTYIVSAGRMGILTLAIQRTDTGFVVIPDQSSRWELGPDDITTLYPVIAIT